MSHPAEPVSGLRRHFRDFADVQPADDQLATILARTAAVRQRPSWLARAPWLSTGGSALIQLPLRYAVVALLAVIVGGGLGSVGRDAPSTPFEGHWTSRDVDGSVQELVVGGGAAPAIRFDDLYASGCATNGDRSTHFVAMGRGSIHGDGLEVDYESGGCVTWHVPAYTVAYDRDGATDTLIDSAGITWHRAP